MLPLCRQRKILDFRRLVFKVSATLRQLDSFLAAPGAAFGAHELALLHVEAAGADGVPFVEAAGAERLAGGALLLGLAQVDDVAHQCVIA